MWGGGENQGNVANGNDGEERDRRWKKRDDKAEREGGEVVEVEEEEGSLYGWMAV